jgi:large conductance mechanosensitive channel
VYFIIVYPLNALKQRRRKGEEPGPSEPTDVQLLIEIRDLLRAQTYSSSDGKHSDRA